MISLFIFSQNYFTTVIWFLFIHSYSKLSHTLNEISWIKLNIVSEFSVNCLLFVMYLMKYKMLQHKPFCLRKRISGIMWISENFSLEFSSVTQLCPALCDPMNCSMPGFPVHHQLPELAQTHIHQVGDAIQPTGRDLKSTQVLQI